MSRKSLGMNGLNRVMRCFNTMLYIILIQADQIKYLGKHK